MLTLVVTADAYERYYGMKYTRLSNDWVKKYFDVANKYLNNIETPVSFKSLLKEVGPDGNSVQFSFATKLFHTLKEDEPIYDKNVRTFLGIGIPNGNNPEEREDAAIKIYENDIKNGFYNNVKYAEMRKTMIRMFDGKCSYAEMISDVRKVDFICWALGRTNKIISEFMD